MVATRAQMKIQQMTFMIIAVFIFFVFVGLFFINWQFKDIKGDVNSLNKAEAISSLKVLANMPEFNCDSRESMCLDEDKLRVLSGSLGEEYASFWPVSSIKVYKIYPSFDSVIKCPTLNCNYFEIFDDHQQNSSREFSTYVSICKKVKENSYVFDKCEIGKLVLGMKIYEG
ncbi:MAG: hypothetical protein NUV97_00510 [archaeon]|nr:hypothetical protein [archaeon]